MVKPRALQPLLDALTTRAALVGSNGVLLSANPTWRQPSGHPLAGPSLGPGTDYLRTLGAMGGPMQATGAHLLTGLKTVLGGGHEVLTHTFSYGADTVTRWSRTSLCPLDGEPRCVAVLHEDVTDEVHTRAALKRSQARLRTILTGAPIVLFSLDRKGVFTVVEGMGGAGTGFVTEDLVGSSVFEAYRHMPHLLGTINEALHGRVGVVTQTIGHLAFEIRCSPMYREHELDGVVGVATDVTERLRAQRMKDEFVSIVSHELRTPLTSIRGSLGLMEGGVAGELPAKARELVRIARSNTDRLIRLINDILDLDKMEAGRVSLQREAVDAHELIADVQREMSGYAEQARVAVAIDASPCPPVYGDRDRLVQVLTNLVSNAIKFSPEGATVHVKVNPSHGRVRFCVRDDGPGIAAVDIPKLFQKFHQLDPSDSRARGGSGLGLVIAKTLVEAHNGALGVDSDLGEGSTFFFEIPVARARRHSPPVARPAESPAVRIDPQTILAPQDRGPTALLAELRQRLTDAAPGKDPSGLHDAHAAALILGSTVQGAADNNDLVTAVAGVGRVIDEAIRSRTWPSDEAWAGILRELDRIAGMLKHV